MKQNIAFNKLILTVSLLLISFASFADVTGGTTTADNLDPYELGYDFKKDGIYYKILSGDSVSTSEGETPYKGCVVIPDVVTYNNVTYKVTKVSGFRNSPDVIEVTIPKYTESITRFYGSESGSWGGPGIKTIDQKGDTTITTIFSSLKKVYFNAVNCRKAYYAYETSTMLGGAYGAFLSIFPFSLENIEFGEGVERVPDGLLYGCKGIQKIVFPKSVKYIGWWVVKEEYDHITSCEFQCSDLQELAWFPKDISTVSLRSSFETYPRGKAHSKTEHISGYKEDISVNSKMFHEFSGIKVDADGFLVLPKWVKKIAPNALDDLEFTFKYNIPETMTTIGEGAFADCDMLEEITIPETVTQIDKNAFKGCSNLKTLNYNAPNCVVERNAFSSCGPLTNIIFGENVTKIPDNMFVNCTGMSKINIPNTIIEIGNHAFENASVTEVTLPQSLTIINDFAFNSCDKLSTLNINTENCEIGSSVWVGCNSLNTVNFGDNVTKIPRAMLYNCTQLKKINIPNTVTKIGEYAFQYTGINELTIPSSVEEIGLYAFANCENLTSIYFNAINCSTVNQPFNSCPSLSKVVFGDNVEVIPESIFMNCKNIIEIKISDSVKEIGKYAFWGASINEITIPKNVIKIGDSPFASCKNLSTIYYNATNCTMERGFSSNTLNNIIIGDDVERIPNYFISTCNNLTEITIPENVTSIGGFAIAYCDNLKKVYFNSKNCDIETIPAENGISDVFWTCHSLEEIVFGEDVTKIPNNMFNDCRGLKKSILPDSLKEIGESAFSGTALTEVTIPNCVEFIGENAFYGCENLKTLYYNAENCEVNLEENNWGYFSNCDSLNTVIFGDDVKKIPTRLLESCEQITKVELPSSITKIGAYAFSYTHISEIVIPDSVNDIGLNAFYNCKLSSITLGSSLNNIGERAFYSNSIRNIKCLNQAPPVLPDNAFDNTTYKISDIFVPTSSLPAYKNADGWKNFKKLSGIDVSSLENITLSNEKTPVFYNLQGVKVENPTKGAYIKKHGNRVEKVIVTK